MNNKLNTNHVVTHKQGGMSHEFKPNSHEGHLKSMDGLALKYPEDKGQLYTQVSRVVTPLSSLWVLELGFPHYPHTLLRGKEAWHDFGPDPELYLDVLFGAGGDQMFLVITPPLIRSPVSSK